MKVNCPKCATSYRVIDEKIPEGGAQIKCLKCNHMFVVKKKKNPSLPMHEQSTPLEALTENTSNAPPVRPGRNDFPPLTGGKVPEKKIAGVSTPGNLPPVPRAGKDPARERIATKIPNGGDPRVGPGRLARGVSAIRAQSGVSAPALVAGVSDSYRGRSLHGLTYDFPTKEAMLQWLCERTDREGLEVAEPGGEWRPAQAFLDESGKLLGKVALTQIEVPVRSLDGGVPESRPPEPAAQMSAARKIMEQTKTSGIFLWAAVVMSTLLVLVVGAATLTRYGVVDLSSILPLKAVGIQFPSNAIETVPDQLFGTESREDPEKVYTTALTNGKKSLRAKRFSSAALEFNRALSVHSGSEEALNGLANAYEGLGDHDRVTAVQEKLKKLKGN